MNINTDDILDAIGTALQDEAKVAELVGVITLTVVGVLSRRSLRKTLILAGLDEKLAKRAVGAVGLTATIATVSVLQAKRLHAAAYPEKLAPVASVTPLRPVA